MMMITGKKVQIVYFATHTRVGSIECISESSHICDNSGDQILEIMTCHVM